jgi:hypothetical protein
MIYDRVDGGLNRSLPGIYFKKISCGYLPWGPGLLTGAGIVRGQGTTRMGFYFTTGPV